jgi:hypothetical protein
MYNKNNLGIAFNNFVKVFNTTSSRLMNENMHRRMFVKELHVWLGYNRDSFIEHIKVLPPEPTIITTPFIPPEPTIVTPPFIPPEPTIITTPPNIPRVRFILEDVCDKEDASSYHIEYLPVSDNIHTKNTVEFDYIPEPDPIIDLPSDLPLVNNEIFVESPIISVENISPIIIAPVVPEKKPRGRRKKEVLINP